jgi:hypothetical protein
MTEETEPPRGKAFVFHFSGGPDSGQSLRFDKKGSAYRAGYALWQTTRKGTIGHEFEWETAGATYHYVVTDRRVTTDAIIVVCERTEADDRSELR